MVWINKIFVCLIAFSYIINHVKSISTIKSYPYKVVNHTLHYPKFISNNLSSIPFPTGAWWTNLVLGEGNLPISPMPYVARIISHNIHIGYPFRVVSSHSIIEGTDSNIIVSFEGVKLHKIINYDTVSVTVMFYGDVNEREEIAQITFIKGSPYITVILKRYNIPVCLSSNNAFIDMNESSTSTKTNISYVDIKLNNGQQWLAFTQTNHTTRWEFLNIQRKYLCLNNNKGAISIAHVPDNSQESKQSLIDYSNLYVIGADIEYKKNGTQRDIIYRWKTQTLTKSINKDVNIAENLLMLSLPHHKKMKLQTTSSLREQWYYLSLKGKMSPVIGDTWYMKIHEIPAEWTYQNRSIKTNEAKEIIAQLVIDSKNLIIDENLGIYTFGKAISKAARLALIADEYNKTDILKCIVKKMRDALIPWFTGANKDSLVFDRTFGGLIIYEGLKDHMADFGNANYNDHHFHFGYILYGIAVLGKFDPDVLIQYEISIISMLFDIMRPLHYRNSTKNSEIKLILESFPASRHKDWYTGHSWASGLFEMETCKAQESSSEAVNAYYSAVLLAKVYLNNMQAKMLTSLKLWKDILILSEICYATELISVKTYWHMAHSEFNLEEKIYEPIFAKNLMVGVVSEISVVYSTWFGDKLEYIHGINMLPFTPATAFLLDKEFMTKENILIGRYLSSFNEAMETKDTWITLLRLAQAIVEPERTWDYFVRSSNQIFDDGNSRTNALHWILHMGSSFKSTKKDYSPSNNLPLDLTCLGFPMCNVAGPNGGSLECCDKYPGCCPNGANSSLLCCRESLKHINSKDKGISCHNEPRCAVSGPLNAPLDCCYSNEGCCATTPLMECCENFHSVNNVSKEVLFTADSDISSSECHGEPLCAVAGVNNTPLLCCFDPSGCCPGLNCCTKSTNRTSKISSEEHKWTIKDTIFTILVITLCMGSFSYVISAYCRRRKYYVLDDGEQTQDFRMYIFVTLTCLVICFFIYLVFYQYSL